MYIIKTWVTTNGVEHEFYWTGRGSNSKDQSTGWSHMPSKAHQYRSAAGACGALMRQRAKKRDDIRIAGMWRSAQVCTSVGVW
jgi:hypothetical protein